MSKSNSRRIRLRVRREYDNQRLAFCPAANVERDVKNLLAWVHSGIHTEKMVQGIVWTARQENNSEDIRCIFLLQYGLWESAPKVWNRLKRGPRSYRQGKRRKAKLYVR